MFRIINIPAIQDDNLYISLILNIWQLLYNGSFDVKNYNCFLVGKEMSGRYVEISAKLLKQFGINLNNVPNHLVNIPTCCNQA